MTISKKFFPEIMSDNDTVYLNHLIGVIESIDELSCLEITKTPTAFHFRLVPSVPKYNQLLLEEILKLHNLFHIKLDISKSIKSSATLVFSINI